MTKTQLMIGKHVLLALLCAALTASASFFGLFYSLENWLADKLYQHEQALDGEIIVLGIDERTLSELGPFQTWNRGIAAELIKSLNADPKSRPAVIGLDLMYFGNTEEEYDERLAEEAGRYGNVVMGSSVTFQTAVEPSEDGHYTVNNMAVAKVEEPYEQLKNVTRQGHLNTLPDRDGIIRRSLHFIELPGGGQMPSFAHEIYQMYAENNDLPLDAKPPMNEKNQWYLPFSAGSGGFSDGFSMIDALNGEFPSELLDHKIVLIGPYATGMRDAYLTSIDHSVPMYGVEIHANTVQALLDQNFKRTAPVPLQGCLAFIVVIALYFAYRRLPLKWATVTLAAAAGGYLGICYIMEQNGYLLQTIYLPLAAVLLYLTWLGVHYTSSLLEKKQVVNTFKRYVAPQVVDEIIKKGREELRLGGTKRDLACLFVDIRGFTTMSEILSPEEVVDVLNNYLELTSKAIFAHEGTLDKFIGDATMALFNAPLLMDDYVYQAVLTAMDIVRGGEELSKKMAEKGNQAVSFGIGINCGPAVVGNIGTDIRMDYTAIGDTINTAARLESQAKAGQILISQVVYDAVKGRISAVPLGEISLKGKTKGIMVYEVCENLKREKRDSQ